MTSPTQRSLAKLRADGYTVQVVERFNPYAKIRQDLFGFIDIVGIKADCPGVFAVQATSASNLANRVEKSLLIPTLKIWLAAGNRYEVWGWGLKGAKGERKTYQVNIYKVFLVDGQISITRE